MAVFAAWMYVLLRPVAEANSLIDFNPNPPAMVFPYSRL